MEATVSLQSTAAHIVSKSIYQQQNIVAANNRPRFLERTVVWNVIRFRIFFLACITLKFPSKILRTYKTMMKRKSDVWGGDLKKIYKIDGRYYFNQYTPGWPSPAYSRLIKNELKRYANPENLKEPLLFIFLAITRKCPMRCEHCFEWDNLNKKESFSKEDLFKSVDLFKQEGVRQFHFSGGEPMVRCKDLIALIRHAGPTCDCWVLTSGFNVTIENAKLLKEAGCKGIVVSIDHYIPELHNMFRGHSSSFNHAVNAVANAKKAGLVVSLSVCATKQFIDGGHVWPYLLFAKDLGVQFVQMLEPRSIGNYEGKNVLLENKHISLLEDIFKQVNHQPEYASFPTMLYHGFHQRRIGCFSGSRSVYVDSAGDVHACPFCHTSAYNIIEWIKGDNKKLPAKENSCPQFGKIA